MSKKQNMEEIYLENRYWVYGSFLRKTGAVEIAEDLSQTLWLHFFQNYENLNLPNEKVVRAYLRSMILHAVADYWRSMQKAEDLMRELEILLEENDTGQGAVPRRSLSRRRDGRYCNDLQRTQRGRANFALAQVRRPLYQQGNRSSHRNFAVPGAYAAEQDYRKTAQPDEKKK